MKIAAGILAVITLVIWIGAGIRLATATKTTQPLISLSGTTTRDNSDTAPKGIIGETGKGGAVVEHLRGGRLDEMEQTGNLATSNPQSGTDYNASKALDTASKVEDSREDDLDDAKKKIGRIGK